MYRKTAFFFFFLIAIATSLVSAQTVLDDEEWSGYAGSTADFSNTTSQAYSGSLSVHKNGGSDTSSRIYDKSVSYSISEPANFSAYVYSNSEVSFPAIGWSTSDGSGYYAGLGDKSSFDIREFSGSSGGFDTRSNTGISISANTWYQIVIEKDADSYTAWLKDTSGTVVATTSYTDTTYSPDRYGINSYSSSERTYIDFVELEAQSSNSKPVFDSVNITPESPSPGENVSYTANTSDSDGSVSELNITVYDDGSQVYQDSVSQSEYSWDDVYEATEGSLDARFRVTDDEGATTTKWLNKTVTNLLPSRKFWYRSNDTTDDVEDYTSNGNNGVATNVSYEQQGITRSEGDWGEGLAFGYDGSGSNINVSDDPSLDNSGSFTLAAWFKPDSSMIGDSNYNRVLSHQDASSKVIYFIRVSDTDSLNAQVQDGDGDGDIQTLNGPSISANEWYHTALTVNSTHQSLYVNGSLEDSVQHSFDASFNPTDQITVGAFEEDNLAEIKEFFDGVIDEPTYYTEKLKSQQVNGLYSQNLVSTSYPNVSNVLPEDRQVDYVNDTDDSEGVDVDFSADLSGSSANVSFHWDNGTEFYSEKNVDTGSTVNFHKENLESGKTYRFYVNATNNGNSDITNTHTFTTEGQVLNSNLDLVSTNGLDIDALNSGSFQSESITTYNGNQYVTFYDNDYNLMVGKRSLPDGSWNVVDTGGQCSGSDDHDVPSIGISNDGVIHVVYCLHNEQINYTYSDQPESITDGFSVQTSMTGQNENSVTYPDFARTNESLFLIYRNGETGNGEAYLNKYDSGSWSAFKHPFIYDGSETKSPYWDDLVSYDGDNLAVSWVTSKTDNSGHKNYSYAYSPDNGDTWKNSSGHTQSVPLLETSDLAFYAEDSVHSGLMHQNGLYTEDDGTPHIGFIDNDDSDYQNYFHATYQSGSWSVNQVTFFNQFSSNIGGIETRSRPTIAVTGSGSPIILYRKTKYSDYIYASQEKSPDDGFGEWSHQRFFSPIGVGEPNFDYKRWKENQELYLYSQNISKSASASDVNVLESSYWALDSAPSINIECPVDGQTYSSSSVCLNVTSSEPSNTSNWSYSLDGSSNQSFTPNTSLTGLSEGGHHLDVYADVNGETVSDSVSFSVDTVPPSFNIESPVNQTYNSESVDLKVSTSDTVDSWEYSLDGGSRESFTPNTSLTGLSESSHSLTVYAIDSAGNENSESVSFTVDIDDPPTVNLNLNASSVFVDDSIEAQVSASDDKGVASVEIDWQNDGNVEEFESSSSLTDVFSYGSPGTYTVEAVATDNSGQTDSVTKTVIVDEKLSINNKSVIESCSSSNLDSKGFCLENRNNKSESFQGFKSNESYRFNASIDIINNVTGNFTLLGFANSTGEHNKVSESNNVTLEVVSGGSGSGGSGNSLPVASYTYSPADPVAGESISFDGSGSSDSDGSITNYEWDWTNDGSFEDTGQTASHTYSSSGDYTAALRVTDDDGGQSVYTETVSVGTSSDDGTDDGGDDGSGGGGIGGGGDDETQSPSAKLDNSSVSLLAPHREARYKTQDIIPVDEGSSQTITFIGEEHTFEVVDVVDDNTAEVKIDGVTEKLNIGEGSDITGNEQFLYVSTIVNSPDKKTVVWNYRLFDNFVNQNTGYFAYNYSVDGDATIEYLVKGTQESNYTILDTQSIDSSTTSVNDFQHDLSSGIYEAKLRISSNGSSKETRPVGFYTGSVPIIDILRPQDGLVIEKPANVPVGLPLDFRLQHDFNVSVNSTAYYENPNGEKLLADLEGTNKIGDQGLLSKLAYKTLEFIAGVLDFLLNGEVSIDEPITFEQNSTVRNVTGSGEYTGYVQTEDNDPNSQYFNTTSIPVTVNLERNDLTSDEGLQDQADKRDNDGELTFIESNSTNKSLGNDTGERYFNTAAAIYIPNNGQSFSTRDLNSFTQEIRFDLQINATDPNLVKRNLVLKHSNSSTEANISLEPGQAEYNVFVGDSDFSNGWQKGSYDTSFEMRAVNGSLLQTIDPDHSFSVDTPTPGLIEYVTGQIVDAVSTIYDFSEDQIKFFIAVLGVGGWYLGLKSRKQDFLGLAGAAAFFIFFSWIGFIPAFYQSIALVVAVMMLVINLLRGEVSL